MGTPYTPRPYASLPQSESHLNETNKAHRVHSTFIHNLFIRNLKNTPHPRKVPILFFSEMRLELVNPASNIERLRESLSEPAICDKNGKQYNSINDNGIAKNSRIIVLGGSTRIVIRYIQLPPNCAFQSGERRFFFQRPPHSF